MTTSKISVGGEALRASVANLANMIDQATANATPPELLKTINLPRANSNTPEEYAALWQHPGNKTAKQ